MHLIILKKRTFKKKAIYVYIYIYIYNDVKYIYIINYMN